MSQTSASSTQAMNGSVTSTNPSHNSRTQNPSHTNSRITTYLQSSTPHPYSHFTSTTTTTDEAIQNAQNSMSAKISEFDKAFQGRGSR
ncbi:hypothetical protein HYFRA_00013773 [Hymenoscyphus fraxineus]|uniref:Uncharacterized protein n=1 Tax=Hymenoscyphus fraxineus TaxID=746836 RepID=A0A9N9Q117_9HELO|nr:hypothetical protein HYFRA_00013773 [Hymenoscyphus fraxineus]